MLVKNYHRLFRADCYNLKFQTIKLIIPSRKTQPIYYHLEKNQCSKLDFDSSINMNNKEKSS